MSASSDIPKRLDASDILRYLQQQGVLQIQPQRHIRDQEEVFTTLLDAALNDVSYVGKVQHLIELYGAAYPHLTAVTKGTVDRAFLAVDSETPTFTTSVAEIGTHGPMLTVEQSKPHGSRSHLPLDSHEHYRIFMESERENSHMRIYLKLVKAIGGVIDDLVLAGLLPQRFASKMRSVDLSQLESAVAAARK